MWSPTHIQVTVLRAKGLLTKGKNNTNNCFVTIGLGKEKYQTSIKDKAIENVDWLEECELAIPEKGNRAELILTCLHRNNLSIDEFLGQVILPLNEMDVYERPRARWFKLQSKPGKEKKKERGELEIRISFTVKAGSLTDLNKKEKHKSSLSQITSNVGGSLLSIGTLEKRKSLKKFAKSMGSKMHITGKSKKDKVVDNISYTDSVNSLNTSTNDNGSYKTIDHNTSRQTFNDADPGVISEDEDEFAFDNLSHKSSGSSLNVKSVASTIQMSSLNNADNDDYKLQTQPFQAPAKPPRINNEPEKVHDEWEAKLYGKHLDIGSTDSLKRRSWDNSTRLPVNVQKDNLSNESSNVDLSLSNTAPNTPIFKEKVNQGSKTDLDNKQKSTNTNSSNDSIKPPRPLPRSATLECISEKDKDDLNKKKVNEQKYDKENNNIFTKKLKLFRSKENNTKLDIQDDINKRFNLSNNHNHSNNNKQFGERIIIGHENELKSSNLKSTEIPTEILKKYDGKTKEEIMVLAHNLERDVKIEKQKIRELEDYLDNLLLRVMETHPKILQNPFSKNIPNKSG